MNKKTALVINTTAAKSIIMAIPAGEIFSIAYFRKEPVCRDCGCRKGIRNGKCPKCESTNIEYTAESNAQKGVENPANATKPGTGKFIGQSAEDAEKLHNNLKYYNPTGEDAKGRGIYRTCGYDRIYQFTTRGVTFNVMDADSALK